MKHAHWLAAFFFGLLLIGCSKKEAKIPDGIIPKDKMVQVMVAVHLAEAHSQFNRGVDDVKMVKQGYYKFIFSKYKITSAQLLKSWAFYSSHPEIFSDVYDDVITELSRKQAEATKAAKTVKESGKK